MPSNSLANLQSGEQATIRAIHAEEALLQRMTALGFRVGKQIALVRRASFAGPLHIRIGSTDVMLRQSDARRVEIADTRPA